MGWSRRAHCVNTIFVLDFLEVEKYPPLETALAEKDLLTVIDHASLPTQ